MILLIDIGNTRIKWARLVDGELSLQSAIAHADAAREPLLEVMCRGIAPERVLISNVAGPQIGVLIEEQVKASCAVTAEFVTASASAGGVRNAYSSPENLGVDRWLAIIGAHAMEGRAACVVSIGTAMTIDGVDAGGRHLGGVIVPGPDLMVSSLFGGTSDIAQRAAHGEATNALFADNTRGAVEQGAAHALAALIERAIATIQSQTGDIPALILTGGATARVEQGLRTPFTFVPDLLLRGLAVLAVGGFED